MWLRPFNTDSLRVRREGGDLTETGAALISMCTIVTKYHSRANDSSFSQPSYYQTDYKLQTKSLINPTSSTPDTRKTTLSSIVSSFQVRSHHSPDLEEATVAITLGHTVLITMEEAWGKWTLNRVAASVLGLAWCWTPHSTLASSCAWSQSHSPSWSPASWLLLR